MNHSMFIKIDARCDEFETAWKDSLDKNTEPPKIENFLGAGTEFNKRLRLALACIDMDYRKLAKADSDMTIYESLNITGEEIQTFREEVLASERSLLEETTLPPQREESDPEALTVAPDGTRGGAPSEKTTAPGPDSPANTAAQTVGGYEIISEIARGGMGVVYKARQKKLNRLCALKMILSGQFAGKEELQRFYVEAEAAANLQHPGIVPVFEVGEIDGQHFYSMGFIDGKSLSQLVAERPLSALEAASLTRKISEAIAYAHSQNVIHRDLKPANVLIDGDGTPKVTDFGLAKSTAGESDLTATGQILGTPSYMPPEQAAGNLEQVDEQSDLYSLGAILYCLLTGRPPFQATNPMDVLLQVLEEEPVAPTKLNPSVPRDLETICLKCIAKDKSKRYAAVDDLVAELTRFENNEPIQARPASSVEKFVRWCKRKPAIAFSLAISLLLLVALSIAGPWIAVQQSRIAEQQTEFANQQQKLRKEADQARDNESKALAIATTAKETTDKTVYARTISLAYEEWKSNDVARAEALLDQTDPSLRHWEWYYTKELCNSETQSLIGMQNTAAAVAVLSDGVHIAAAEVPSPNAATYVWNAKTGIVIKKHARTGLAFSPDGKRFAALVNPRTGAAPSNGEKLGIYQTLTGKKLSEFTPHPGYVSFASFSPDGTRLATCGNDSKVRIWSIDSSEMITEILEKGRRRTHPVFWSEDSQWIGWKMQLGKIKIYQASDGQEILSMDSPVFRRDTNKISIHRGKGLVASGEFGVVHLFDIKTKKKINSIFSHTTAVTELTFLNDGSRLVSAGGDQTVRVWRVDSPRELAVFRGHKPGGIFGVASLAVSEDEQWIVSAGQDRSIKTWSLKSLLNESDTTTSTGIELPSSNQEMDILYGPSKSIFSLALSPDGSLIAMAGADRQIRVLDSQTGKEKRVFDKQGNNVGAVTFHPSKKWIASGSGGINDKSGGKILVWDYSTGEVQHEFKIDGPVSALKFVEDGDRLIATSGSQAVVRGEIASFDMKAGKVEDTHLINSAISVEFSPDSTKIAAVTLGGVIMYDLAKDEFLWTKQESDAPAYSVAFSPDSTKLAIGKRTHQVGIFDVETGKRIWHKVGHLGVVTGVRFFDDGNRIVSVCNDKTTKIWNSETGDILLSLRDDGFEKFGVQVHPDQKTLYVFGEAPYVTVRSHAGAKVDKAKAEFTTLFTDDFERKSLGKQWTTPYGDWTIVDGALKGKLVEVPSVPGYISAAAAPKTILPSYSEIEYDTWSETPMIFQTTFADTSSQNAVSALYIGLPVPFVNAGRQGAAVSIWSNWTNDFTHATDKGFRFEPNRKYRVKSICDGRTLKVYCDGVFITERKIPSGFQLTTVTVSGAFATTGSTVYFDNVTVRIKNDQQTRDEIEAIALELELHKQLNSKSLILAAIDRNTELTDNVKQLACKYAEYRVETAESRREEFGTLLSIGNSSQEVYEDIEKIIRNSTDYAEPYYRETHLAICCYRLGKHEEAIRLAKSSEQRYLRANGSSHAINAALLAMANFKMGNNDLTEKHLMVFRELRRSRHWNPVSTLLSTNKQAIAAEYWENLIRKEISQEQVDAVWNPKADEAEILRLTFDPLQVAELDYQAEEYFKTFADDSTIILGRTQSPNELDRKIAFKDWKACQSIWYQGAASVKATYVRDQVNLKINGDQAELTAEICSGLAFAWWRVHQAFKLRRTSEGWKIMERRDGLIQRSLGPDSVFDESDWKKQDDKCTELEKTKDLKDLRQRIELAVAYDKANRLEKAFELLLSISDDAEAIKGNESAAHYWHALSMYAWQMGKAEIMQSAIEKSMTIDPKQGGPSYFVATATKLNLPEKFKDYGHDIQLKVPEQIKVGNPADARFLGKAVGYFLPTEESCFFVSRDDETFKDRNAFEKTFQEKLVSTFVVGFKAQCYRQRIFRFRDHDAFDLIIEGNGTGNTIQPATSGIGKGTILRIVGVRRKDDVIFFVVCSFADQFDQHNSLLEVIMKNANLD